MSVGARAAAGVARAWYRILLRVHPSGRRGYGPQMAATFDTLLETTSKRGMLSVAVLAMKETTGLILNRHSARKTRRARRLDALGQDLRFVVRSLAAAPAFTLLVVTTLALGMGANGALFVVIDRIFFRPPPGVQNVDTLTRVYRRFPRRPFDPPGSDFGVSQWVSYPGFRDIEAALRPAARLVAYAQYAPRIPVGRGESPEMTHALWVSAGYFSLLGASAPALGRYLTDEECRVETPTNTAVISYDAWQRRFGSSPSVIGAQIELNRAVYTIVGVAARGFSGIDTDAVNYWMPLGSFSTRPSWYQERDGSAVRTIARSESMTPDQIASVADAAYHAGVAPREAKTTLVAGPLLEARGPTPFSNELKISTRLAGVALTVLLIACANVTNLLIARSIRRRHEISIRLALGISRSRLTGLFLLESLVLSLTAAAASFVVAQWGAAAIRQTLMPDITWATAMIDYRLAVFAFVIAALTTLAIGLPVGLRSGRTGLTLSLKSGSRDGGVHRSRVSSALLVTQVALSIVLLIGAAAFIRSLLTAEATRTGYETDRLLLVSLRFDDGGFRQQETAALLHQLQEPVSGRPGVDGVALSGWRPLSGYASNSLFRPDGAAIPSMGELQPSFLYISPGFFRTSGIPIQRGRDFSAGDTATGQRVMAVNRSMAQAIWPGDEAIGQCLRIGKATNDCVSVVSVVEDTNRDGLIDKAGGRAPMYFMPLSQGRGEFGTATVAIVRSVNPRSTRLLADALETDVRGLLPRDVYATVTPMRDTFANQLRPWVLGATLFGAFGLLAVTVASIGTYSLTSYSVSHRTREMAIRTALGAAPPTLVRLIVRQGLTPVVIGIAAGIVLALLSSQLITSLLYQTSPADPRVLAAACVTMGIVAVAGCVIPAWRAARIDPIVALKAE